MKATFPATRDTTLKQLNEWLPGVGDYAALRNYDLGSHVHVSRLSPAVQRRLVSEQEIVEAALATHPFDRVEKFIQEVCWRTYWKGWLQGRPGIFADWLADLGRIDRKAFPAHEQAVAGSTGIDCFDHWTREIRETGYLHNHARMWFASIWIFTLRLPWQLGALFFWHHLLDADPASNTLSWRWVAGLQTQGKTYTATADTIAKYTRGKFFPENQLAATTTPPKLWQPHPRPAPEDWPAPDDLASGNAAGLWIHSEDLSLETLFGQQSPAIHAILGTVSHWTGPLERSDKCIAFDRAAMRDALDRATANWRVFAQCPDSQEDTAGCILEWAAANRLRHIVAARPFAGPWSPVVKALERRAPANGITLHFFRRPWDTTHFPKARAGFFPFWESMKKRLRTQGSPQAGIKGPTASAHPRIP